MAHGDKRRRQFVEALRYPQQWTRRIAQGRRFDEPPEIINQCCVTFAQASSPPPSDACDPRQAAARKEQERGRICAAEKRLHCLLSARAKGQLFAKDAAAKACFWPTSPGEPASSMTSRLSATMEWRATRQT